jgi:hypothetical protein
MNLKSTVAMLALVCATGTGAAASAGAATLGTGDILSPRQVSIPQAAGDQPRLWQARQFRRGHRRSRSGRRHRRRNNIGFGFGFGFPFWALAPTRHYYDPPPVYYTPPPAPAWRFDGVRWVCDYVDYYGRPACR